jgi:hypothetical protein
MHVDSAECGFDDAPSESRVAGRRSALDERAAAITHGSVERLVALGPTGASGLVAS